jgi:hypothetical protein
MPPSSRLEAQTPEPKSTGGLAGVFKSLTSGKGNKSARFSPLPSSSISAATVQLSLQLNGPDTPRGASYGGPTEYEELYEKLKPENSFTERIAAADGLRPAVTDYPLSGVSPFPIVFDSF